MKIDHIRNVNFVIEEKVLDICKKFANDSINLSADTYGRRKQFNIDKIKKDIRCGKLGEFYTFKTLYKMLPSLSAPDFEIYQKKDKNWSPDLSDECGVRLAVKSQDIESALYYEDSWVFQYNQNMKQSFDRDLSIFGNVDENYYVSFVSLNVPKKTGIIRAIVKVKWLIENNLFKPLKKSEFKNNKLAVYWDDIVELLG